jgi:hypothetical protein
MNDLTLESLVEKLAVLDADIARLREGPGNDRKLAVLSEYREYIQDEIKYLS